MAGAVKVVNPSAAKGRKAGSPGDTLEEAAKGAVTGADEAVNPASGKGASKGTGGSKGGGKGRKGK
jgi:hypothetical protein